MLIETDSVPNPYGGYNSVPTKYVITDVRSRDRDIYPICEEMVDHIFEKIRDALGKGIGPRTAGLGDLVHQQFRVPMTSYVNEYLQNHTLIFAKNSMTRQQPLEEDETPKWAIY